MQSKIGVIGLSVMGSNLAQNFAGNGIKVSVFNRSKDKTKELLAKEVENLQGFFDLSEFVSSLEKPRKILLSIKSGQPVDDIISNLTPLLDSGDILIDGGNSKWTDTARRQAELAAKKIFLIGCGVSGGEKGALLGPSLMPGGSAEAVAQVIPILQKVAALDFNGMPCVTYVGDGPAGHFTKMVHNGIEYAMMQQIAEVYHLIATSYPSKAKQIELFDALNKAIPRTYLLEITSRILQTRDDLSSSYILDVISPAAGSKGTGQWCVEAALELQVPINAISASLQQRAMSQRSHAIAVEAFDGFQVPKIQSSFQINDLAAALRMSFLLSYVQGMELIKRAGDINKWGIDISEVVRIWQGGCIIRSQLLEHILDQKWTKQIFFENFPGLAQLAGSISLPMPVTRANYDYAITRHGLYTPTNLTQAQRDFFGSHGFRRLDREGDFHLDWDNI